METLRPAPALAQFPFPRPISDRILILGIDGRDHYLSMKISARDAPISNSSRRSPPRTGSGGFRYPVPQPPPL
jgi:hypothetical protein